MTLRISAVIPTFNRAAYLRKAIQSLVDQTLPREQYEILIVDNCSTDETKQVVLEEFGHVPNLRYLYEPVLGLNQARNTGWQNSLGKYVAYTDDDAIVASDWLECILDVWNSCPLHTGCVGGPVEPIWEAPRPGWLSPKLDLSMTIVDWMTTPGYLSNHQWLVGANIAFPRQLLNSTGGFRLGFDRTGNKLLSGGEIVLQKKLALKGYNRFYHPKIAVKHHLSVLRLTQKWVLQRWYWEGVSEAWLLIQEESMSRTERLHFGLYKLKQLVSNPRNLLYILIPTQNAENFFVKCVGLGQLGYLMGMIKGLG